MSQATLYRRSNAEFVSYYSENLRKKMEKYFLFISRNVGKILTESNTTYVDILK